MSAAVLFAAAMTFVLLRAAGLPARRRFRGSPRRICCECRGVIAVGDPGFPGDGDTHGIGPCCWDSFRAANGLAARPYPAEEVLR